MRRRGTDRDAKRLAEAFADRERDLAVRAEALTAAEQDGDQARSAANLARGLDEIDEAEYAERIAAVEAQVAAARAARDCAVDVLAEVARAAADAAEAVERIKVEAASADVRRIAAAREEAEAVLVKLAADEAQAEERLVIVERWAKDARAPFDADAAAEAERLATTERGKVAWYVQERYEPNDARIEEPWLRGDIAAETERRKQEDADYRQRLRERPDRVDAHGDPDSIPQLGAFPVTRPLG